MKANKKRAVTLTTVPSGPSERDGRVIRDLMAVETNTATACVVLATAQAADALLSRGSTADDAEAPASLRVSCIVLVACAASPPIREYTAFGQRGVATGLLGVVALAADHRNGLYARISDGACAVLAVLLLLFFFTFGPMHIASKTASHCVQRDVFCALPAALMVHTGFRIVRSAFAHPWDAQGVRVGASGSQLEVGYAFASTESGALLAFGGALVVGTGVLLLSSNDVRQGGSAAAASAMFVSAAMQFVTAFAAMIAQARQVTKLPALFGASACEERGLCGAAFESRRNVLVSTASSVMWLTALATVVVAYAPSLRTRSGEARRRHADGAPYAVGALGFATWRLVTTLPFDGDGASIEWCVLVALVAVATSAYLDAWLGAALFVVALVYDLADVYVRFGFEPDRFQPTDAFVTFSSAMMAMYILLAATYGAVQEKLAEGARRCLDTALGVVASLGTSASMLLYLLSAASTAAFSGASFMPEMFADGSESRFYREAIRFAMKHYFPLLIWLVPYAEECSNASLSRHTSLVLHFVAGVVPVTAWAYVAYTATIVQSADDPVAYVPYLADTPALVLAVASATVAWVCLAFA